MQPTVLPEEARGGSASRRVLSEPLPSRSVMPAPPEEVTTKLDLRGVQADDAVEMLDAMLDRAVRGGWPLLLVVHGHGISEVEAPIRTGPPQHIAGFEAVSG
jgi:hypothetical protein